MGMNATCVLRICEYLMGRKKKLGHRPSLQSSPLSTRMLSSLKTVLTHQERLGDRENLLPHSRIKDEPPALPAWTGPSMAEPLIPICQLKV